MELRVLDPFGDYETKGYLRNLYAEKNLAIVAHLEAAAFEHQVQQTVRYLRRLPSIRYEHITETHRRLFDSVYPWAGEDRSFNAPHIAIGKAGYVDLFAHPADVKKAVEYALSLAVDHSCLRTHPGEVFGYLAHAHPFLEGNGRAILTVFADLCRRAGFHVRWPAIDKTEFLQTLTDEIHQPGKGILDTLVLRYVEDGVLTMPDSVQHLNINFRRTP